MTGLSEFTPSGHHASCHHATGPGGVMPCKCLRLALAALEVTENEVRRLEQSVTHLERQVAEGTYLTLLEQEAIAYAGTLWGMLCELTGDGPTREADLVELVAHIHAIQRYVMGQAAARAYPGEYRLLGETLSQTNGENHD